MHVLPSASHPARALFDTADLAAVSTGQVPVHCTLSGARKSALATMAGSKAASRVVMFNVDPSNDQLRLISVGRRGGVKVEWVFGPITRGTRLI